MRWFDTVVDSIEILESTQERPPASESADYALGRDGGLPGLLSSRLPYAAHAGCRSAWPHGAYERIQPTVRCETPKATGARRGHEPLS